MTVDAILVHDPDLGEMQSVVLPATSFVFHGVPLVQDIDHEILVVRRDASLQEIYDAIDEHRRTFGQPPRAVLVDWGKLELCSCRWDGSTDSRVPDPSCPSHMEASGRTEGP